MSVNQEKERIRTITAKVELDATQSKEELKEIENQIEVVTKKYKEFQKLSGRVNLVRDIFIALSGITASVQMFREEFGSALFSLILILVIGQVYKK